MTEIGQSVTVKELIHRFLDARQEIGPFVSRLDFDAHCDEKLPFSIKITVGFDEDEMDAYYDEEYGEEDDD